MTDDDNYFSEPWSLTLARQCYDMRSGVLTHLPYSGGIWDQPEGLLHLIGTAWRAWYIWGYKQKNSIKWDEADSDFMAWVTGKDDGG